MHGHPTETLTPLESERAARLEAERVSAVKDQFLATLGHELRTPLNAILGWSRLLELGHMKQEEVQRGAQTIARNARVLAEMVNDLLDLTGMMNGSINIEAEETDIREIVHAAVDNALMAADTKGVALHKQIDAPECHVFGDPGRLQQVIRNLLSNAIKFTPRGGRVDVSLQLAGNHWRILVADSGAGIAAESLPFVFDRFRREDASLKAYSGLGLGLAIAKQLVVLHGGTVSASSAGPGLGTTFTVLLPRLASREELSSTGYGNGAALAHEPAVHANGSLLEDEQFLDGLRVLVVDDEPDTLDLLKRVLGDSRAEVMAAPSADAALATLSWFLPHVLVSDLSMPGRNGYDLIRTVRAGERSKSLPAIALTAFARPEDALRAQEAGFQVHLAKPVEPSELIRVIARLAGRA